MLVVTLEAAPCIQGEPNLELILILILALTMFSLPVSVWIKLASTSISFGCSSARALSPQADKLPHRSNGHAA